MAELRTHGKALVPPVVVLLVMAAVVGLAVAMMPDSLGTLAPVVLAVLVGAGVVGWVVVPFLRWWTTTYTLTSRRLITRSGILSRHGHDLPLDRITDVTYERSLTDRMLGCGTLQLSTASDTEPLVLPDVPDVGQVHLMMTELIFGAPAHRRPDHEDRTERRRSRR